MNTVTVEAVSGPADIEFVYLRGTHTADDRFVRTRTVARSAIAAGYTTRAAEIAALQAEVEQLYSDYLASQ